MDGVGKVCLQGLCFGYGSFSGLYSSMDCKSSLNRHVTDSQAPFGLPILIQFSIGVLNIESAGVIQESSILCVFCKICMVMEFGFIMSHLIM